MSDIETEWKADLDRAAEVIGTDLERFVWSSTSINDGPEVTRSWEHGSYTTREMRRLTWRELYERADAERQRLNRLAPLLSDLDRCEHGRHEGDVCSGCGGPSRGNPFLDQCREGGFCGPADGRGVEPRQIGYTLAAKPITVPVRGGDWIDP